MTKTRDDLVDDRPRAAELAAHAHGRVPRALRRRQALAEAHDLFTERGYAGTSMEELARRMGVSKPVVYELVGSKDRLFADVMARVHAALARSLAAAAAGEPDLPRRLRAGILAFLRFARRRRKAWAALVSRDAERPGGAMAALRQGQAAVVAALLAQSARRPPDPRVVEVLALAVNGAVEAAAWWWQANPALSDEALADLLAGLLAPGLAAVLDRPPARRPRRR